MTHAGGSHRSFDSGCGFGFHFYKEPGSASTTTLSHTFIIFHIKPFLGFLDYFLANIHLTMAPSLEEPVASATFGQFTVPKKAATEDNKFGYVPGRTTVEQHEHYAHEDLLPSFPDIHWGPIEHIPYEDRGIRGDPKFRNLLQDATAVFDYNPKIGTEIHGVDLAKLNDAQRDDLARLVAYRGVVFFREQKHFDIEAQRELGKYFGKLHKVGYQDFSEMSTTC